jgi:hypothetical protein
VTKTAKVVILSPRTTPMIIQPSQIQTINWGQALVDGGFTILSTAIGLMVALWTFRKSTRADNQRHKEVLEADELTRKAENERHTQTMAFEEASRKAENSRYLEAMSLDERLRMEEKERDKKLEVEFKNSLITAMLTEVYSFHTWLKITNHAYAGSNYVIETTAIFTTVPDQIEFIKQLELIKKLTEYRIYLKKMKAACERLNEYNYGEEAIHAKLSLIRGNWNSWHNDGKKLNEEVRAMLIEEFDGEVPEEFKTWQSN